ncbi:MAG: ribonuclease Z [Prevotellaceae bacterium]|jgi:ribonuclease Z|nr:ribonuclease Z [Prevotellaceae bacterium]
MEKMNVTILGCGSALPTKQNFPSCQLLKMHERLYMLDCGEGAQIRMQQMGIKTARLDHIFISHLHGDHCFGLIGLLSSLNLLHRTNDLHIHALPELEIILKPQLDFFCSGFDYKIIFNNINPKKNELIFENKSLQVTTIPLKHRVPSCGFLFREKERERHIKRDMIDFYQVPVRDIARIKKGEDFRAADGNVIANHLLTNDSTPAKSYAYCSDTAYYEKIIPIIENVDCLYHEATFAESESARAKETTHSTARQAATIAKLASVKQLILGHFSSRYTDHQIILNEAQSVFPNAILAEDRKKIYF